VGEFSGIDSTALQGMTNSFKGDKDHLRSRASSYRTEFAGKGMDTSALSELLGICGWMDDQAPMLDRRYHLALAADQPYPGHQGMVSIDESMVGTTVQSKKDGKALAGRFDQALDDGDQPSEDLFAALQEHADDADYLKAFYEQVGPKRLQRLTNSMAETMPEGRYGAHPDQISHDRDVLAKTFGTYTKVAFEGRTAQQKQAGWNKWFDDFQNPQSRSFQSSYLLALLPGGSQDKDFLVALGDRVWDSNPNRSGAQYLEGGSGNGEFGKDHLTQLFHAIGANPEASGEWMDHNYDLMQKIIYPGMIKPLNEPQSRMDAFVKMMHAGTIGLKSTNRPLSDQLTARIMMDNWRHQKGDDENLRPYDPIDAYYGQLVTANWSAMVYGITSPIGDTLYGADPSTKGFTTRLAQWDQKAFLASQDPNHPGLELGAPLWQALLNESARDPKTAGEESALFDSFRTQIDNQVDSAKKDTDDHAQDYRMMQRGMMIKAYSQAFDYAEDSIEGDANRWADEVNGARTALIKTSAALVEGVATDGASAITDLGTDKAKELGGTATDLLTDYIASKVSVSPEDAPGLAAKYKSIDDKKLSVTWQDEYRREAKAQLTGGGFSSEVTAPVTVHPRNGAAQHFTGDPAQYIESPADNFLNKDKTVMDVDKMTPRQRTAYGNWLMDPAIVNHVDSRGFTQGEQFQHLSE